MKKIRTLWMGLMASFMLLLAPACSDSDDPQPEPGPGPDPILELEEEFAIELLSCDPLSFEVSFTPKDEEKTYFWNCLTKSDYDIYTDEDAVIDGAIDYLRQMAALNGMNFEVFLRAGLKHGYQEWGWNTGIDPNTDYVVYCFGLTTDGTVTTKLTKLDVHTPSVAAEECTFEIEVNTELTTASSLVLTVKPSNDTTRWYASVFEEEAYYEFCGSSPAGIPDYLKDILWPEILENYGAEMGYSTIYDAVQGATKVGQASTDPVPVFPNQTYYLFAVGVGVDGSCVTEPKVVEWKAPNRSNMIITLTRLNVGSDYAEISISPSSAMETYAYVTVRDEAMMVGGQMPSDEEIIARCLEMTAENSYPKLATNSGGNKASEYYLYPSTKYTTYAFGYAADAEKGAIATTGLFKCSFETSAPKNYGDDAIGIRIVKQYKDKLALKFTPKADPMMTYYFDILPEDTYQADGGNDEAIKKDIQAGIKLYMDTYGVSEEVARVQFLNVEERSLTREGLKAGTAYRIYAVGMYADGTFSSSIVSCKAETLGDMLPFDVIWTPYNAAPYKGAYCYLLVPSTQQGDVDMWYFTWKVGDATFESLSDDELAEELRKGYEEKRTNYYGYECSFAPYTNQYISFDYDAQTAYVYAVYYTHDGQHGPLVRTRYGK